MRKLLLMLLLSMALYAQSYMLVTNNTPSKISRVNLDTGAIELNWIPDGAYFGDYIPKILVHRGYAYVVDNKQNEIDRINLGTKTVEDGWATITAPKDLATDGNYLYVVTEEKHMARIHFSDAAVEATWVNNGLSNFPHGIDITGGYAYVTTALGFFDTSDPSMGAIDRVKLSDGSVEQKWYYGSQVARRFPFSISYNGGYLYIANAIASVDRLSIDGNTTQDYMFVTTTGTPRDTLVYGGIIYVASYYSDVYRYNQSDGSALTPSMYTGFSTPYGIAIYGAPSAITLSASAISENLPAGSAVATLSATDNDLYDTHTFSLTCNDANFSVTSDGNLTGGIVFDYEATPTQKVCVRATDSYGLTFDTNITITIIDANDAPVVTSTPVTAATQDVPYSYTPSATDVDGDTPSWSATSGTTLPSWLGLQENATWTGVGSAGFSASQAPETSLVIDGNGTPYVAYQDVASSGKATVKRYDGTNWVTLGSAGFSADSAVGISLALDGSDTPYVAYRDIGNGAKATVMKFDGANWVTLGSAGFSAAEVWDIALAISGSGTPYVVYQDRNIAYRATVMKFDGTNWVNVGSEGFSAGEVNANTIAIDSSGTAYVGYQDQGNAYKATVMKFDGINWVNVGTPGFSAGVVSSPSLAIDGGNRPYFAYTDEANGNRATVMMFDGTNWVALGNTGFSAGQAAYNSIAIKSGNTPYVAYSDGGNGDKATVMKFDGANWVSVGTPGISADGADFTSIAFDGSGVLYLAFRDWNNSYKATVMKTVGFLSLEGTPGSGDVGTHDVNLTVSDGNSGNATHNFTITVGNVNDTPTGIALSSNTIAENSAIGTDIGTLSTTDADAGDTHTYSFTCNTPTGAEGNFNISAATLQSGISFDFESAGSYTLCIRTTDLSGATYDANVTISITNVNESVDGLCGSADGSIFNTAPATNLCVSGSAASVTENSNSYDWSCNGTTAGGDTGATAECSATRAVLPGSLFLLGNTIVENSAAGTPVGTLSADGNVTGFSFCGGADDGAFAISGNTLQTAVSLDYESGSTRTVCIRAAYTTYGAAKLRAGTATLDQNFTITLINDASDDAAANAAVSVPLFGIPGAVLLALLMGLFGLRRLGRDAYM